MPRCVCVCVLGRGTSLLLRGTSKVTKCLELPATIPPRTLEYERDRRCLLPEKEQGAGS